MSGHREHDGGGESGIGSVVNIFATDLPAQMENGAKPLTDAAMMVLTAGIIGMLESFFGLYAEPGAGGSSRH